MSDTVSERFNLAGVDVDAEARKLYGQVFSGGPGSDVLAHMLGELGFFDPAQDSQDIVLRNYAVRLLQLIGVIQADEAGKAVNVAALTRQLLTERKMT
jgi:hypothetical protein